MLVYGYMNINIENMENDEALIGKKDKVLEVTLLLF